MEFYTRMSMKDLLAQSLYLLLEEKQFDKITIKQITEKAGVIRGTFYNHFYDKYEALEYLTYLILIQNNRNTFGDDDYKFLHKNILKTIEKEKKFFVKAFKVDGQNNFEDMLINVFKTIFIEVLEKNELDFTNSIIDKELFARKSANTIAFLIKTWIFEKENYTYEDMYKIIELLFSKSVKEIMNDLKKS